MKKNSYIKPKMKVAELEYTDLLAGSFNNGIQSLSGDDDERENVIFE